MCLNVNNLLIGMQFLILENEHSILIKKKRRKKKSCFQLVSGGFCFNLTDYNNKNKRKKKLRKKALEFIYLE